MNTFTPPTGATVAVKVRCLAASAYAAVTMTAPNSHRNVDFRLRGAISAPAALRELATEFQEKAKGMALDAWLCEQSANQLAGESEPAAAPVVEAEVLQVASMLSVSNNHLTTETRDFLDRARAVPRAGVIGSLWGEFCWIVYVYEDDEDNRDFPADLLAVLRFARDRKFDFIKFDIDAPTVALLPRYED